MTTVSSLCLSVVFFLVFINPTYSVEKKEKATISNHHVITEQEWSIPKTVQSILSLPALQTLLSEASNHKTSKLLIRYPDSDVGILWATELKAWLIALGLESRRIELQSGSQNRHQLELISQ